MANILVTGASGFIGSFIVEEALERGFSVWAGVRATSSHRYLKDPAINFIDLDYEHPERLRQQLSEHFVANGCFDYVVHCAGVTKCADKDDFNRVNFLHTKNLADALVALNVMPRVFVFMSTLSVFGPVHETMYEPIREDDAPRPNTAYGVSKLKAERYLQSLEGFPYLFLRPSGVYGPRERDYFLMAKSISNHFDFSVGYKRQDLTFVYVRDVVQAVFLAIEGNVTRRAFFLTDGQVYQSRTFSNLIIRELEKKAVIRLRCPLFILKTVSVISEWLASLSHSSSTLNGDKYKIMKQRNWRCDISPTRCELGYDPQYQLDSGVRETIAWYKEEGWL